MKNGQILVLFAVTRTKKKHRVTYKDSFKGYRFNVIKYFKTIFIGIRRFFFVLVYVFIFWFATDIFRTKNDIPRIFLEHECIFCG